MHILLVEDEDKIADIVSSGLSARGFRVDVSADGHRGLDRALHEPFDAIVLDIMLPGRDGLSVLRALRAAGRATPVLLLTARNELDDRLSGLALGADDYLAKPFYVEELAARLEALHRRATGDRQHLLRVGALALDRLERRVSVGGRDVELTGREFAVLEYLMRAPGQIFTRSQILEHVWGYDFDPCTNVVDVCIKRLRARLAPLLPEAAASPIEAVRGAGYRLRAAGAEEGA